MASLLAVAVSPAAVGAGSVAAATGTVSQTADVAIKDSTLNAQNSAFITIPDSGQATPYPSNITISGEPGTITDVNVSLVTLTHTAPRDLLVTLVGPHGQQLNLMRFAGGTTDVDKAFVTFDDEASETLVLNEPMTTGMYKPADIVSPTSLSVFDDTDPNGTWSLQVTDTAALDSGHIELGWALSIQRTPTTGAYPSTIDVSGLPTGLTDVNVTLSGLTHSRVNDVDVLLVGPSGQQATLMSDVGGTSASDATLQLDDEAVNGLAAFGAVTTGSYRPTNLDTIADPYFSPAPVSSGDAALSAFDGTNPNGTWRLYVVDDDDAGDFTGLLSGWALTITTPDADAVAPTGSVVINGGAARTRSRALTLSTTADGTGSAVSQMRFSNDGSTWSAFEAFAATKSWSLPTTTNGLRTVWAQYRDAAGNLSSPVSDAIVLDTVRPKVIRTTPGARATGVRVGKTVSARLSETVRAGTISATTAYITRAGSTKKVRAVVRYDAAHRRIVINPRTDLVADATYRVTITTGVKDRAGNNLDQSSRSGLQAKRWKFTTE